MNLKYLRLSKFNHPFGKRYSNNTWILEDKLLYRVSFSLTAPQTLPQSTPPASESTIFSL